MKCLLEEIMGRNHRPRKLPVPKLNIREERTSEGEDWHKRHLLITILTLASGLPLW